MTRFPIRLLLIAIALFLVTGCGSESTPQRSGGGQSSEDRAARELVAELEIVLDDGDGVKETGRLECPSDHEGCEVLEDREQLEPIEGNVACTQQYGGPETAVVTGTIDDEPVEWSFSRENGCEIARYERASALWSE